MRYFIVLFLLLHILILTKLDFFGTQISGNYSLWDFDAYMKIAEAVRHDINPYTIQTMQTLGPPSVILYFLPFSLLPINIARMLATILNIAAGYLTAYLLSKKFYPKHKALSFLIMSSVLFSAFPARLSLIEGQPTLLAMLFITLILINKKIQIRSVSIALLTIIKTNFLLLTVALAGKRKLLIPTLFLITFMFLITLVFIKPEWYIFYFKNNFLTVFQGAPSDVDYYNQTLKSTFYRFSLEQMYPYAYFLASTLSVIYLIVSSNIPASVILSLILSPVLWQHYFVMLFPVLIYTYMNMPRKIMVLLFYFVVVFFWWAEFPYLHTAKLYPFTAIIGSHYLLSAIGLLFLVIKYPFGKKLPSD